MPLYVYQISDFDKIVMFTVDRNKHHATATTVNEREMLCAYFIYIKTDING